MSAREDERQSEQNDGAVPFRLPWGRTVIAHKPYPNELRDHLANVRTFLAWVRTAIAMMGFGFVIAKFGLLLREMTGHHIGAGELHLATIIGSGLVLVGGLFLLLSTLDFLAVRRQIERQLIAFSPVIHIILAGILLIVAVAVAVYVWITGFQ